MHLPQGPKSKAFAVLEGFYSTGSKLLLCGHHSPSTEQRVDVHESWSSSPTEKQLALGYMPEVPASPAGGGKRKFLALKCKTNVQ